MELHGKEVEALPLCVIAKCGRNKLHSTWRTKNQSPASKNKAGNLKNTSSELTSRLNWIWKFSKNGLSLPRQSYTHPAADEMETYYGHRLPTSPRLPRHSRYLPSTKNVLLSMLSLFYLISCFAIDYHAESFQLSPIICHLPGSYTLLSLRRCRPIIPHVFGPNSLLIKYPKPLPRVQNIKKVQRADSADDNLAEAQRVVESGFKFAALLEDLQTMLGNNADLYTLLGRGEAAVRKLLTPLIVSKKINE
jgi:hypothetical protein